ncbi:MAG: phosphoserine aminotransferase, partial [Sandarakinorhabdus sp.]|nr:phosphoserine aminotransferase [Sandarakinorhabdus sp.]
DATSAVFAQDVDWAKVDVLTYSWQKVLGGEGAHGMLILGPRAVERLESHTPPWPLPKIFRLVSKGKLTEGVFVGETINTPSMLAVEDYIDALLWAQSVGGLDALKARANANAAALDAWVQSRPWVEHLARDAASRSNTSVCLVLPGLAEDKVKAIVSLLEKEDAAYDIGAYRDIWCGATVDTADVVALTHWLDWAYAEVTAA